MTPGRQGCHIIRVHRDRRHRAGVYQSRAAGAGGGSGPVTPAWPARLTRWTSARCELVPAAARQGVLPVHPAPRCTQIAVPQRLLRNEPLSDDRAV